MRLTKNFSNRLVNYVFAVVMSVVTITIAATSAKVNWPFEPRLRYPESQRWAAF